MKSKYNYIIFPLPFLASNPSHAPPLTLCSRSKFTASFYLMIVTGTPRCINTIYSTYRYNLISMHDFSANHLISNARFGAIPQERLFLLISVFFSCLGLRPCEISSFHVSMSVLGTVFFFKITDLFNEFTYLYSKFS